MGDCVTVSTSVICTDRLAHFNVKDLLSRNGFESEYIEYKKAWHNKKDSGERGTYWQVLHSICAFANGKGGHLIIGVEERVKDWKDATSNRGIILPPCGVPPSKIDKIQNEILGACREHIWPLYSPRISIHEVGESLVLVITCLTSGTRPLACRENDRTKIRCIYIRRGPRTEKASYEEERQLLSFHSNSSFDDRQVFDLMLSEKDIDYNLVQEYLDSCSPSNSAKLLQLRERNDVFEKMDLVKGIGLKRVGECVEPEFIPKNVALLFFHQMPHQFFKGAKTLIGIFTDSSNKPHEIEVTGPIDHQISKIMSIVSKSTKEKAYPRDAVLEAVVNAYAHRSYEDLYSDPVRIWIEPDHIEIVSYPGPHPDLTMEALTDGGQHASIPCRNGRIVDFLKRKEWAVGWYTGILTIFETMKENGNPKPSFGFTTSSFCVRLPSHPNYTTSSSVPGDVPQDDGDGDDSSSNDDDDDKDDDGDGDRSSGDDDGDDGDGDNGEDGVNDDNDFMIHRLFGEGANGNDDCDDADGNGYDDSVHNNRDAYPTPIFVDGVVDNLEAPELHSYMYNEAHLRSDHGQPVTNDEYMNDDHGEAVTNGEYMNDDHGGGAPPPIHDAEGFAAEVGLEAVYPTPNFVDRFMDNLEAPELHSYMNNVAHIRSDHREPVTNDE